MKRKRIGSILLCLLLVAMLVAGCSKNSSESPQDNSKGGVGYTDNSSGYDKGESVTPSAPTQDGSLITGDAVVVTGNVSMETQKYDETIASIKELIASNGGKISAMNSSNGSFYENAALRQMAMTARIPSDKTQLFLDALNQAGHVVSSNVNAQDVKAQVIDLQARLDSARTMETRLLDLLTKSDKLTDIVELERTLRDIRTEIETLQAQQRGLNDQISMSTIGINIKEVEVLTDVTKEVPLGFWARLGQAFVRSWESFTRGLQTFFIAIARGSLQLLLFAIFVTAIVLLCIKLTRPKKK